MLDIFNLQGQVVLFTGASRGLGKAMAVGLAKAGADIAVVGRRHDPDVLDQIAAQGLVRLHASSNDASEHIAQQRRDREAVTVTSNDEARTINASIASLKG